MIRIQTIDEMLERDSWSDETFELEGAEVAVWRSESRKPIYIHHQDNFTIDGGLSGITIYGTSLILHKCTNVTLRNLTIRLGAKDLTRRKRKRLKEEFDSSDYNGEALKIKRCEMITVENCTFSWGLDETVSIQSSKDVTVRDSLIVYPLYEPRNFEGQPIWEEKGDGDKERYHAFAISTPGSKRISYTGCVIAHAMKRSPQFAADGRYETDGEVRHSVIYNFTEYGMQFNANDDGDFELRIHDNYFSPGRGAPDAINIESPKKGSVTVEYSRNVQGTPDDFRTGSWSQVEPETDGSRVHLDNEGDGYPDTEFSDIVEGAGPNGSQPPYTWTTKQHILGGELPQLLSPHEPEDFGG